MNRNTQQALIKLCEAIDTLTGGVVTTIGMTSAAEILQASYELRIALRDDDTITHAKE